MSNSPFEPFDENGEVRIYGSGYLPHWRQAGCTYFVTFRLADSVPTPVLNEWIYERNAWLKARGIDPATIGTMQVFKRLSPQDCRLFERHFVGKLFEFLDRHGECLQRDREIIKLVADALRFFHSQRLDTGDFAVLPNHVHVLMTPYAEYELEDILHSVESFTANQINERLNRSGTLWMEESYDHIVRGSEELLRIQAYIRADPSKAKLAVDDCSLHQVDYDLTE